ncbi:MAG: hypothetical protein HQ523_08675 [Lentisphaerae bacterium]|nr:hypothetical protein [Lentisphaerota bacterium]
MRKPRHISFAIAVLLAAVVGPATAALQTYTFDRYASILQRQPFGEVTAEAPPPVAVPRGPVAPPFTQDIKMCAITEDDSGIKVGFVNVAIKPPKSYLLRVGEAEDDILLVRADYDREMALLKKGDREEWISMAGAVDMAAVGDPAPAMSASGPLPNRAIQDSSRRVSYAERRRRRREAVRVREVESPKLEGEELKKHLEQYQMDLIRNGMPPLPMQLTEDMDAQLVSEGVLPPADAAPPAP